MNILSVPVVKIWGLSREGLIGRSTVLWLLKLLVWVQRHKRIWFGWETPSNLQTSPGIYHMSLSHNTYSFISVLMCFWSTYLLLQWVCYWSCCKMEHLLAARAYYYIWTNYCTKKIYFFLILYQIKLYLYSIHLNN